MATDQTVVIKDTPEKEREWWPRFLAALRNSANVRAACEAAGIERKTAYRNRHQFKTFAKAWDEAVEEACDILEAVAFTRAKKSSDLLLIFLLKAHRPELYRERTEFGGKVDLTSGGKPLGNVVIYVPDNGRDDDATPAVIRLPQPAAPP